MRSFRLHVLVLALLLGIVFLGPCNGCKIVMTDEAYASARMKAIVSAINVEDQEALQSLFSQKAQGEMEDFGQGFDTLLDFLGGPITSWEQDVIPSSDFSEYGKRRTMLRPSYYFSTDHGEYTFYLIDYKVDTFDPENQGLYMLEVSMQSYDGEWEPWQERMRPGISIIR